MKEMITAVTVVAEMGDLRRFAHPKQMMADIPAMQ